jgi:RIO-like serine/threonine protein kinase
MTYTKHFIHTSEEDVIRECLLQRVGAEYGLSPSILETDGKTFITMEDLNALNIGDIYGDSIEDIPDTVKRDIWNIVWILYSCCGIEYIDVTPYNFIEKEGRIWVIDYGHAKKTRSGHMDEWLHSVLDNPICTISEWNPHFL